MKRFKDPNHLPVAPKFWRDPVNGHKIEFKSAMEPFSAFLSKVWSYCDANGRTRPTQEAIENELCAQMPSWACVGDGYHAPARNTSAPASGGCRACGGRK